MPLWVGSKKKKKGLRRTTLEYNEVQIFCSGFRIVLTHFSGEYLNLTITGKEYLGVSVTRRFKK
jgi:hypothetical protein